MSRGGPSGARPTSGSTLGFAALERLLGDAYVAQLAFYAISLAVVVAVALASWTFFEEPILRLKRLFPTAGTAAVAGGSS